MPLVLTADEVSLGVKAAGFGEAYDSAVIAFTNFHLGRFSAKVFRSQKYIAFFHSSKESRESEVEKKAYETFELQEMPEGIMTKEGVKPLRDLIGAVERSFSVQGAERVKAKSAPD